MTPAAPSTELVALDLTARSRDELATTLRALGPIGTIAVGASLFDGRFGIPRPRGLTPMPSFRSDVLDPAWCHGDLLVQVENGALTEQIPHTRPRWRITGHHQQRNLFGFREGAGNPDPNDPDLMDRHVWVQPGAGEPAWCVGGTYQVVRLIRLAMPTWDREPAHLQEKVFGRHKDSGAPLGAPGEQSDPAYPTDPDGHRIALDAHIRRANPRTPESQAHQILRRSHTYHHSPDDTGQIFTCYQNDIPNGFATIQQRLAGEALEKYLLPYGGGYYFVLPAPSPTDPLGHSMLTA
ncbi:deferrochelatase/peroxidase EfeB [Actinokineospora baliensis]|uniref:Dyp-type peroxidase n=1 Tax=Actinokineospora baliensis TaxID=547056 RepID=UPI001956078B|nr:Dyp-type peroxidase [Actinokineospora baliensis]MBM7774681.1 deferrochelatase/peroxidase EfeB [Actinokineospora baliensis]